MSQVKLIEQASDFAIADWLHRHLTLALAKQTGRIAINLPGGSTPFPILAELALRPLDWTRIDVWPGDDRIVEEASQASNVGRIRAQLEPLGARIVPLTQEIIPPHFVLTWLGMGADGHIASLFPNTDPQVHDGQPVRRLLPDPLPPEAPYPRLTLTIPALLDADQVLFVIRGADKRELFEAAMRREHDLPVARLLAAAGQLADCPVTCFA